MVGEAVAADDWPSSRGAAFVRTQPWESLSYSRSEMGRVAFLLIAVATAAMAAMLTGSVAHDDFGVPLDVIRVDALRAAGALFAAVACGWLLMKRRR